jgi:hypothetical protein
VRERVCVVSEREKKAVPLPQASTAAHASMSRIGMSFFTFLVVKY